MTKVAEQIIAETVVYDDKYDVEEGNCKTSTNNNNHNASEEEEEGNATEEEKEQQQQQQQLIIEIETKYERYRDDQMNTGIIAALVGGFALTNSWEMNIYENNGNNLDLSNIELSSYTLAILAVHGCTCSALVSAFLYRSITRVKSPQAGVQWVERHPILVQLPWFKVRTFTFTFTFKLLLQNCSSRQIFLAHLFFFFSLRCFALHCIILYYIILYSFYLVQHPILLVLY